MPWLYWLYIYKWIKSSCVGGRSFLFSTVPFFVIGCSTMVRSASCLRGSPVRRGQLRDILWRVPASCPAYHFPEIWYWGSTWWCTYQNTPLMGLSEAKATDVSFLQELLHVWRRLYSIYGHGVRMNYVWRQRWLAMTQMEQPASQTTVIFASLVSCSLYLQKYWWPHQREGFPSISMPVDMDWNRSPWNVLQILPLSGSVPLLSDVWFCWIWRDWRNSAHRSSRKHHLSSRNHDSRLHISLPLLSSRWDILNAMTDTLKPLNDSAGMRVPIGDTSRLLPQLAKCAEYLI